MRVLLLDMDGVLLEPLGYHRALQTTVALIGRELGYKETGFGPNEIAAFEAAGVTNEWDSSAISSVLLLEGVWDERPDQVLPTTPSSLGRPRHTLPPPDFRAFARLLAETHPQLPSPLARAERILLDRLGSQTGTQKQAVRDILQTARRVDGPLTHRIFQELVLGSRSFAGIYGLAPCLDTESYLLCYDRPALSERETLRLLAWLTGAGRRAVIFTGRPSRPPGSGGRIVTPEAEIGAQTAGLDVLPIVGLGGLSWLGARRDVDSATLVKPGSVHALAALRQALGDELKEALEAAAALALDGYADAAWRGLHRAEVYVFEDAAPGLRSVRAAGQALEEIGVQIRPHLCGVSRQPAKRRALEAAGATVVSTLVDALDRVPEM